MQPSQDVPEEQPKADEIVELQPETPLPEETEVVSINVEPPVEQKPQKSRKKLIIALLLFILALLLAGGGFYWWYMASNQSAAPVAQKQAVAKKQESPPLDPVLAAFITPKTGEKWLAAPKKISNQLGYYTGEDEEHDECTQMTYYEAGARGDSTIILGHVPGCVGDGTGTSYLFERAKDGKVSYIARPISNADYTKYADGSSAQNDSPSLAKSVKTDTTTHYDSLSAPNKLSFGSNQVVNVGADYYPTIGAPITTSITDGTKETTVKTYGQSKLRKIERQYVDTKLTAINYVLNLPSGTQKNVTYTPITNDLSAYTWNDGTVVKKSSSAPNYYSAEISGAVRGCGAERSAVTRVDDAKDADFVAAGKTPAGQTVYAFKDANNHVVKALYKDYVDSNNYSDAPPTISIGEFVKQHAIVVFKDSDSTWLVYSRDQFALSGGCGKPVVYLYPTKTQAVNVRVGANVSVSIPQYNPNTGWNAIAQPNGQLSVNGQQYDSLFWEGTGHGLYPGITAGTVVKRADAASTIRAQLLKQGLNQKETNDFLAFWQPRIPNDPYIRLTWFNTAQLDKLAPLTVSPKPDTAIRVFLDMAGYSSPVNIPAQKLTSTERKGFTLVEWGGLIAGTPIAR